MHINDVPASKLPELLAGLVRQGLTFDAMPSNDEATLYTVKLTGGY